MQQSHEGMISVCKPDVVLVSAADVSVADVPNGFLEAAAKKPEQSFSWRDVRTVIEFKIRRRKARALPTSYTKGKYLEPPSNCKYLSLKPIHNESAIPLSSNSLQVPGRKSFISISLINSDGHAAQSAIGQSSATQKRKSSARVTQRESQPGERLNKASRSSSKRQRVETSEANPNKICPGTQMGIYGAEMFASHAGRQHVLCLTIIGSQSIDLAVG